MNSTYFFLPFILVAGLGIYQDSFALETVTGYNYFDVTNPDGSHTWTTHEPYINDNGVWVPFINSGLQTQTDLATIILNADGSYTWSGKFTDKIIAKYADVSNLNSWTYPNTLNNDTPDVSWNGSSFISSKAKAGIGQLDYKYVLIDGEWKTQLEATNLSALTTKAFGFDQVIDLDSDTISFGGITRNLDDYNGTTFAKPFLEANEDKIINLLNDIHFDFDLGFYNLYSVTVYDTGVNKSRLVFDYRTSVPLLPGETLIIDPTFTGSPSSSGRTYNVASAAGTCNTAYDGGDATTALIKYDSGTVARCHIPYFNFDVTSISDSISSISSMYLEHDSSDDNGVGTAAEDGVIIKLPNTGSNSDTTWGESIAQNFKYSADDAVTLDGGATNEQVSFTASAFSDIITQIRGGNNTLSMAITPTSLTRQLGVGNGLGTVTFSNVELVITYTTTNPPYAVTDLTSANIASSTLDLIWSQPYLGGGNQFLLGYQINYTNPWGQPVTLLVNDTASSTIYYNVTGLTFGTDYSFRVSAWTNNTGGHPFNNATGNILNVTTTSNTYSGTSPTLTAFGPSSAPTQIDLEFPGSTLQNINGYRIQRETPIGSGWTTIVSNTTSATQYYNNTGLTSNIIYNYRVYAMNGSGLSSVSNEYDMTTWYLPYAVTDLIATATSFSVVELDWSAPIHFAPEIIGYLINYTTPEGDPLTIVTNNTMSTDTDATVTNLVIGDDYSFRVAPITVHGTNSSGNIANATTSTTYVLGNLTSPDQLNTNDFKIFYNRTDIDSTTISLKVIYPQSYDLDCNFFYKFARINDTYTTLTETVMTGPGLDTDNVYSTFQFNNVTNDIINVNCYDVSGTDHAKYVITITDFELLNQIDNLQNGTYGTQFEFGAIDGVMLIIVFIGMIGFNRVNPVAGVMFTVITVGGLAYFGIIEMYTIVFPALALVVLWAYTTTRKDD